MKKTASSLALILTLALSTPIWAQGFQNGGTTAAQGGYQGAASANTVAQALKQPDDAWVTLVGKITKQIGGDKYQFTDSTGSVIIEIDQEYWGGLSVGPNDMVEISGEVDKDMTKTKIDVKRIIKR